MHSALIDLSGKHSEIWIHFPWMLRLPGDSLLTSTLLLKADRRWDLQAFAAILTENHVGSDGFHLQHLPLSLHPPPPRTAQQLETGKRYSGCDLGFADQAEHGVSLGISWPLDVLAHGVFVVVYLCMCVCQTASDSFMRINHGQISRWTGTSSLIYPIRKFVASIQTRTPAIFLAIKAITKKFLPTTWWNLSLVTNGCQWGQWPVCSSARLSPTARVGL